jgi:L-ribulose-5-phosphate 3-epimerase
MKIENLSRRQVLSAAGLAVGASAVPAAADQHPEAKDAFPVPPRPAHGLLFSCKYRMIAGKSLEERLTTAREAGLDGVDFDDAGAVTPAALREAVAKTGTFIHNAINGSHWKKRLTSADAAERAEALANLEHCIRVSHAAGGSGVLLVVGTKADGPEGPDRAREEIRKAIPLAAALGQRILFENVWNGLFYEDDGPRDQSVKPLADYVDSFRSPWVGVFFDLGNHACYCDVVAWIRDLGPRIVKLDIKGYSNAKADKEGNLKGFVDIADGDIDWAAVRGALRDIGFTGWVSAEVQGGDLARLRIIREQMHAALLG